MCAYTNLAGYEYADGASEAGDGSGGRRRGPLPPLPPRLLLLPPSIRIQAVRIRTQSYPYLGIRPYTDTLTYISIY